MNNNEELEEEKCLACDLVEEYFEQIKDGMNEESALRYVIHMAMDTKEDEIADLVDATYSDAFEEGLRLGVEKGATLLNELVDYTDKQIAEYRAEREAELNGEVEEESEEIEDISDEDFEEYAKIIREYQERNL